MISSHCILRVSSLDQLDLVRDTESDNGVSNLILEISAITPEGNISKKITEFKDANIDGFVCSGDQYYNIYFECNSKNLFALNGDEMKTYSLSSNNINQFSIDQGELIYENNIYKYAVPIGDYL